MDSCHQFLQHHIKLWCILWILQPYFVELFLQVHCGCAILRIPHHILVHPRYWPNKYDTTEPACADNKPEHSALADNKSADHKPAEFDRSHEPAHTDRPFDHASDYDSDGEPFQYTLSSPDTAPEHPSSCSPPPHHDDTLNEAQYEHEGLDPMEAHYVAHYTVVEHGYALDAALSAEVDRPSSPGPDNYDLDQVHTVTALTHDPEDVQQVNTPSTSNGLLLAPSHNMYAVLSTRAAPPVADICSAIVRANTAS
ncbi:hypothetical protein FIBSPDRAFT_955065 [Athelia psychrophila]|uniref:Uncharacterized protein n=1 Tax=Athelia psychrophila TaxID=1759441 RepID=A0A166IGP9_9AGAM|nr:hypothetical protein FIBSPDRAFT_955065 [Fibularhizoctonia sp. CBS 109695]